MHIEHVAIWVNDLEKMRSFYEAYLGARSGSRYENAAKRFTSYFMTFESGARLELMHRADVRETECASEGPRAGFAHVALVVGDEAAVDDLSERLRAGGYRLIDGPRRTGDGYYESVVLDPEGNRLELAAATPLPRADGARS
jgi:lactoylglutathione lyase